MYLCARVMHPILRWRVYLTCLRISCVFCSSLRTCLLGSLHMDRQRARELCQMSVMRRSGSVLTY